MFKRANQILLRMTALIAVLFSASVHTQELEIDGEIFRDPTRPPFAVDAIAAPTVDGVPQFNLGNFSVSFIRSGGINPVAVINNRMVEIGDEITTGVRVSEIRAGAVVVNVDGQDHVLSLYNRPVRQNTAE